MAPTDATPSPTVDSAFTEAVRTAFEAACAEACRLSTVPGVYVAPLWDLPPSGGSGPVQGWKRAVLRRVEGAGAEHWGHLFLLVSADSTQVSVTPARDVPVPGNVPKDAERRVLREGPPAVLLLVRPLGPGVAGSLTAFAESVERSFHL